MTDHNYQQSIIFLQNALARLHEVLQEDISEHNSFIDATIQRFEFTFELFWKALKKKIFYDHALELNSPKSVLQAAYTNQLIMNEKMWLNMLSDRNLTLHTYNQELALEIYHRIQQYEPFLQQEFRRLF